MRRALLCAPLLVACAHAPAAPQRPQLGDVELKEAAPPPANPADVASVDAIVKAAYDVISGPAGPRDWNRMRSLFAPGARLIAVLPGAPPGTAGSSQMRARVIDVAGYITLAREPLEKDGFVERELGRRVEQWGDIAQVFSTYESRHKNDVMRGINSFQLYQGGGRWWILSILWEDESPERPLPKEVLP